MLEIGIKDWGHGWENVDARFDVSKPPNEAHRAGDMIEFDPLDTGLASEVRTILGQFERENAELIGAVDGRIALTRARRDQIPSVPASFDTDNRPGVVQPDLELIRIKHGFHRSAPMGAST